MKNFKILAIMLLIVLSFTGNKIILSRGGHGGHHGHHGGGYWGGRGYWGGYGWGAPYWGGYYGPYAGLGWGWPSYYSPRASFAKDNAGKTYWMVYNNSKVPLRIKSDRDETILPAGAAKKLYRRDSFALHVYNKNIMSFINTRLHDLSIYLDETGKPHVKA